MKTHRLSLQVAITWKNTEIKRLRVIPYAEEHQNNTVSQISGKIYEASASHARG